MNGSGDPMECIVDLTSETGSQNIFEMCAEELEARPAEAAPVAARPAEAASAAGPAADDADTQPDTHDDATLKEIVGHLRFQKNLQQSLLLQSLQQGLQ